MPRTLDDIRYPLGRFTPDAAPTPGKREGWIAQLAALPGNLRTAIADLTPIQLDSPYREGAWTLRQITHHVADEYLNAFQYCKMALTEDAPEIRKYTEPGWAETPDGNRSTPEHSLVLLTGLHARWTDLFQALSPAEYARVYVHPSRGHVALDEALQLYAWHGRHHTAQVLNARAGQNRVSAG